jgi:hypothetical protein
MIGDHFKPFLPLRFALINLCILATLAALSIS